MFIILEIIANVKLIPKIGIVNSNGLESISNIRNKPPINIGPDINIVSIAIVIHVNDL